MRVQEVLTRQWSLIKLLSKRPRTVKELASHSGVGLKTIRRDLVLFRDMRLPLEEIVEERGRKLWRLLPQGTETGVRFSFDEAIALYFCRSFIDPLAGTLFWEASQSAFRKIRTMLTDEAVDYIEHLPQHFYPLARGAGDYRKKAELIDTLMLGIEQTTVQRMTYHSLSSQKPATYRIHPYGMVYSGGSLYLVGHSEKDDALRHWKVDRMLAVTPTKDRFTRPDDFNLSDHFSAAFGIFQGQSPVIVRILFDPPVARHVQESRWHPSQRLNVRQDGSVVAWFELNDTHEISRWVLSFGKYAEVLEPEGLREELRGEIREMRGRYG